MPRSISFPADPRLSETFAQRLQTRSAGLRDAASGKDSTLQPRLPSSRLLAGDNPAADAPSMLDFLIAKGAEVNQMQHDADQKVHSLLTGGDVSSAEVLTAVQKADMAFRTLLQVRNKLIEAYRDVLQIQV